VDVQRQFFFGGMSVCLSRDEIRKIAIGEDVRLMATRGNYSIVQALLRGKMLFAGSTYYLTETGPVHFCKPFSVSWIGKARKACASLPENEADFFEPSPPVQGVKK
jgi:hypothetical protein